MLLYNLCDLEEAVLEDPQALMSCRPQVPFTAGVSMSPGVEVQDFDPHLTGFTDQVTENAVRFHLDPGTKGLSLVPDF